MQEEINKDQIIEDLKAQIVELKQRETAFQELGQHLSLLEKRFNQLQDEKQQEQQQSEALITYNKKIIDQQDQEIKSLKDKLKTFEEENDELLSELESKKDDNTLQQLKKDNEKLLSELKQLKDKLVKQEQQQFRITKEYDKMSNDFLSLEKELENENQHLKQQNKAICGKIENLQTNLNLQTNELKFTRKQYQEAQNFINQHIGDQLQNLGLNSFNSKQTNDFDKIKKAHQETLIEMEQLNRRLEHQAHLNGQVNHFKRDIQEQLHRISNMMNSLQDQVQHFGDYQNRFNY